MGKLIKLNNLMEMEDFGSIILMVFKEVSCAYRKKF
jgi:hypothetical protein